MGLGIPSSASLTLNQVDSHLAEAESATRTIYVETTGNDTTGDGTTVGTAFATLTRALSDIKKLISVGNGTNNGIILQFGAGTFPVSLDDIMQLSLLVGIGRLDIKGTFTEVLSSLSFTQDPTYPQKYTVGSVSWTNDQYQGYFINDTPYYAPIHSNTSSTLYTPEPIASTANIYDATILQLDSDVSILKLEVYTQISGIIIDITNIISNDFSISNGGTAHAAINIVFLQSGIRGGSKNVHVLCGVGTIKFFNCYIHANLQWRGEGDLSDFSIRGELRQVRRLNFASSGIIENPGSQGMQVFRGYSDLGVTSSILFKNCLVAFRMGPSGQFRGNSGTIYIEDVNYLMRLNFSSSPTSSILIVKNLIGSPSTNIFFDTLPYQINPQNEFYIYFQGITFPEIENDLTSVLTNNTTTNITVGSITQNRAVFVNYTITRGSAYRTGIARIVHDGSSASISDPNPLEIGTPGITTAADINSNELRFNITLDDGVGATIDYSVNRIMI